MNNRIHTTIILAAAAFAACSGLERADIVPATKTSRIMLVREGAADVSVYAFRRQGAVFLFDTLLGDVYKRQRSCHKISFLSLLAGW